MSTDLQIGQELHGFTVQDVTPLTELNATLYCLKHTKTGARLAHFASADSNNLFAVGFRTPPQDSTGVAHILEHTVLCGSKRYPVRDPFFNMLKRSLNTFMNALTASDWTLYPFSSQNKKDFYNLMGIYLDASFFPLLREQDFAQEGHRLEFAQMDNPDSELLFKGVVYNEMKGAMASPPSLLGRRLETALYPTTTYKHNSGGEPAVIPELTWEDLRDFHSRYYHPSNAWFFTYGNFPLEEHLAAIEEQALSRFEAHPVDSAVPLEKRFNNPRRITETFPLEAEAQAAGKSMVQLAWLNTDIADSYNRLALTVLSSLLLGNPGAPLYKALLESGLGENLAPGTGYHDENRTTYFAVGLQGTDPDKMPAIEQLVLDTLQKAAEDGFSAERIEGVLHRLEFEHKEITGDHYPYALGLLMRAMGPWLHNEDIVSPLQLDQNLGRLRAEIAAGPFFEDLIRTQLLENQHRVTLTLQPDQQQTEREEQETRKQLAAIGEKLSADDINRVVTRAKQLQEAQERQEDVSCLPTLGREDIPPEEEPVPARVSTEAGLECRWYAQPTNGIDYLHLHLPVSELPTELLPFVPLFATLLTQIGAAGYTYTEMAERMEAGTGGIRASTLILESPDNLAEFEGILSIKGKALVRNQDKLFTILQDLFTSPDFTDLQRLQTVIGQLKVSLENSVPSSGHSYAARAAAASLTAPGRLREAWSGLAQIALVKETAALPADALGPFAEKMQNIARLLLNRRNLQLAITGEESSFDATRRALSTFLDALGTGPQPEQSAAAPFTPHPVRQGWATSVPVSYVARVFRTVPYNHPDAAPLAVLAKLLRSGFLHREIREKGGAYGGMCGFNPESGLFSLLSYRDPHLTRTLDVYDRAVEWAVSGAFTDTEVTEALLAVFSDLDRPLAPGSRGGREFANTRQGLTLERRNRYRKCLLAVTKDDLVRVAETYLQEQRDASSVAVISSEAALNKANGELAQATLEIARI